MGYYHYRNEGPSSSDSALPKKKKRMIEKEKEYKSI